MTQTDSSADLLTPLKEEPKRPDFLNVLTILTFIGSGLEVISAIYAYFSAPKSYAAAQEVQGKLEDAPAFVKSLTGPDMVEMARKQLENRTPILLLTLVACALCVYGAIQLRNLKKIGFSFYLVGEVLPIITSFVFIGAGVFGGVTLAFSLLFPLLFIILYATQLKKLP